MGISAADAINVIACLTADGWLETDRPIPTHKGMALSHYIDRPRLPRADADQLLADVIEWAANVNRSDLTIRVERLDVYGSYWSPSDDVGDLDLIVVFNSDELLESDELQPEHEEEIDDLLHELQGISEYVSPADELDQLMMPNATYKTVFQR